MRHALVAAALLALVACGREEAAPVPSAPPPAPASGVSGAPTEPARYAGRWAVRPELCAQGAWTFTQDGVTTAGEVSCAFSQARATASGYRIEATCTAEGPPQAQEITLTLTDPAPPERMTVAGGPWAGPVTLVRCAP